MPENFESTYESSIPVTFTGSGLPGGNHSPYYFDYDRNDSDRKNPFVKNFNQDFWEEDGYSLTGNPNPSPDTITFSGTNKVVLGCLGEDHISLNSSPTFNLKMTKDMNPNGFWKYEEDKTLKEIEQYLSSTYHSHYTSETSKTQTLDLIESIGDAEAFTRSNAIKYLSRFGKKNGKSKMDILKAIHYCILLYHFAGLHKKSNSDFPY
jgi:hypothetical protein